MHQDSGPRRRPATCELHDHKPDQAGDVLLRATDKGEARKLKDDGHEPRSWRLEVRVGRIQADVGQLLCQPQPHGNVVGNGRSCRRTGVVALPPENEFGRRRRGPASSFDVFFNGGSDQ
ncbi:hypothetical protein D9M72_481340 [compost metagenome]